MVAGYFLGLIVHIWTIIIAFTEAGLFGAILSLIFPFLSEIYWVIMLWGVYDAYVNTAILATVLVAVGPFFAVARGR